MEEVWLQVYPILVAALVAALVAVLNGIRVMIPRLVSSLVEAGVVYFEAKTKIAVEGAWQHDLHKAMTTGADSVLSGVINGVEKEGTLEQKVDAVIAYSKKSVPEAIAGLAPSGDVLRDMALAKLKEKMGSVFIR